MLLACALALFAGSSQAPAATPPPAPVLDQPAALCQRFRIRDPANAPRVASYDAANQFLVENRYAQAFATYYGLIFCPKAAGRYEVSFNPSLENSPALYELQTALQQGAGGDYTAAIRELYLMKDEPQASGEAYFFIGVTQWALAERKDAEESWVKAAESQGYTMPNDATAEKPEFARSAQELLLNLAHVVPPVWPYGGEKTY